MKELCPAAWLPPPRSNPSARLIALHTGSKSWTQPAEPGIRTQGLLGWDHPGTHKLRLNPFPGPSPMSQWCVSVCVGTYRCPQTSIQRNTRRVATHRGHYRQETGHKDKMPGRRGKSRLMGVAQIVHLYATLDFTLVNSPNSSSPYGLFRPNTRNGN